MIITLEIYYGYTRGDPDLPTIVDTLANKDTALTLLYISRFLSGWSAGESISKTQFKGLLLFAQACVVSYQLSTLWTSVHEQYVERSSPFINCSLSLEY